MTTKSNDNCNENFLISQNDISNKISDGKNEDSNDDHNRLSCDKHQQNTEITNSDKTQEIFNNRLNVYKYFDSDDSDDSSIGSITQNNSSNNPSTSIKNSLKCNNCKKIFITSKSLKIHRKRCNDQNSNESTLKSNQNGSSIDTINNEINEITNIKEGNQNFELVRTTTTSLSFSSPTKSSLSIPLSIVSSSPTNELKLNNESVLHEINEIYENNESSSNVKKIVSNIDENNDDDNDEDNKRFLNALDDAINDNDLNVCNVRHSIKCLESNKIETCNQNISNICLTEINQNIVIEKENIDLGSITSSSSLLAHNIVADNVAVPASNVVATNAVISTNTVFAPSAVVPTSAVIPTSAVVPTSAIVPTNTVVSTKANFPAKDVVCTNTIFPTKDVLSTNAGFPMKDTADPQMNEDNVLPPQNIQQLNVVENNKPKKRCQRIKHDLNLIIDHDVNDFRRLTRSQLKSIKNRQMNNDNNQMINNDNPQKRKYKENVNKKTDKKIRL